MKLKDMVMVEFNSYTKTSLMLFEVKRITKTLIIVGKYGENKEIYKFKKCNDVFDRGIIGSIQNGTYTPSTYLYNAYDKRIIKRHLEICFENEIKKRKANLINFLTKLHELKIEDYIRIEKDIKQKYEIVEEE